MAIGEALPGLLGELPQPHGTTAPARLVAECDPPLLLQCEQVLAGAHGGHLQLLPQRGGALRAMALEQKQDLVGACVHDLIMGSAPY